MRHNEQQNFAKSSACFLAVSNNCCHSYANQDDKNKKTVITITITAIIAIMTPSLPHREPIFATYPPYPCDVRKGKYAQLQWVMSINASREKPPKIWMTCGASAIAAILWWKQLASGVTATSLAAGSTGASVCLPVRSPISPAPMTYRASLGRLVHRKR